ncbi:Smr/MutS family protein [Kumtagia ephedrae]|jgi:DNA-nicking Smr family endonuclease|uniref:DNA mismatch repair protein MutS n=1 Tax=Kumtagia ephedrae TaxID=2116701 RepID=A0A2P7S1Q3_9HYPH|nr:Smr/MutS family protein [Mesorhizobium ephedrae]PSJ56373.1 DNA mismatch repair protein MutS [Mesorhizobium ephedrae]
MSRRSHKTLTDEDRVLWSLVARSATPLKGRKHPEAPAEPPLTKKEVLDKAPPAAPASPPVAPARPKTLAQNALDRPTHDKLAAGRLPIEGRVDLHGLTQDEAYPLLFSFLHRAHANGIRYVLVITGKGSSSGGDGVLRRAVPGWLATAPFRGLVSSHDHAARNHGGGGALYVRLRRPAPR